MPRRSHKRAFLPLKRINNHAGDHVGRGCRREEPGKLVVLNAFEQGRVSNVAGADKSGADIRLPVDRVQLATQHIVQPNQRVFGRSVVTQLCEPLVTHHGGDCDNMPPTLFKHRRQELLEDPEVGHDICVHGPRHIRRGQLRDGPSAAHTRVVDQNRRCPVPLQDAPCHRDQVGVLGHVAVVGEHVLVLDGRLGHVQRDDLGPLLCKAERQRRTKTTGTTCEYDQLRFPGFFVELGQRAQK